MCTEVFNWFEYDSTVYGGVLISRDWNRCVQRYSIGLNRVIPLYTGISSFQGIGIDVYRGIQLV